MKVKNVQERIREIENFEIIIRDENGRDVPDHRSDFPSYGYSNQARHNWTVSEWKEKRFKKTYVGFEVDVLDSDGNSVPGQTKLSTVRNTYLND